MNIEIQKYYTENIVRIEYLGSKIKNLEESINVEFIYKSYEAKIKEMLYSFAKVNELIIINYEELDLTKFSLMALGKEIIKWNLDDLSGFDWTDYLEDAFDINLGKEELLQLEDVMNVIYEIMGKVLKVGCNEEKVKEIKSDLRKYFEELRQYQKEFDNKTLEVKPQIETFKKEKEMLIQINKQLEKDYEGEIIICK